MDLEQYAELAGNFMGYTDPKQKHKGLSSLIDEVGAELPDTIIVEHRDFVLSNDKLRYSAFVNEILHQFGSGKFFHECVDLLSKNREDIEQWECDDAATIEMRKAKLKQYAQTISLQMPPKEVITHFGRNGGTEVIRDPHPDRIYCQHGIYRKYDQHKNGYYYRLGRIIQTNDADNGDLKKTMKMVCLYVALVNEQTIVEKELTMLGEKFERHNPNNHNRQMQYYNITDLRESAGGYKMLTKYDPEFVLRSPEHYRIAEPIERLHNAIDELSYTDNGKLVIKTDEIRNVLDAYNPNQHSIAESLNNVIEVVTDLRDHVGEHMGALLRIDPGASNVFCFLNAIVPILETELQRVIERKKYAPTEDDEKAVKDKLIPFIEGKYGDLAFGDFMRVFIVNGISQVGVVRRLSHMIANCPDDKTKGLLIDYLDHHKFESDAYAVETITRQRTQTQNEPMPRHEPPQSSPSTEATSTDDAALPNFSNMKSYTTPTKLDVSALYEFLVAENVITDIDDQLFANCITHAHMNKVWSVGNHHKLKCVFRHLKDHFPNDWIDVVAKRMGTTRKRITAFDRSKIRDFEMRLTDII